MSLCPAEKASSIATQLAGRQMVVRAVNGHNEAYEIARVSDAGEGLLRVDLANCPPFSSGWYQVQLLDASKGNRLLSSRKLIQGTGNPWWWGAKAWFPERGKTYTIRRTGIDRVTVDFADAVRLRDEGIEPGDWFVLYAIEPGLGVEVPDASVWCAE